MVQSADLRDELRNLMNKGRRAALGEGKIGAPRKLRQQRTAGGITITFTGTGDKGSRPGKHQQGLSI